MKNKFYVATPIYYVNGIPHIGHFYSTIIANTIYKYNKISGKDARFTTGVDENSQKAVLIAEEKNMEIMDYLDEMAVKHKQVWDFFDIDYTDFLRTTEDRHHKVVRDVLDKVHSKGDIYEGVYEGMYCVGCESFKKDEDLVFLPLDLKGIPEGGGNDKRKKVCPDHLKAPDKIKEKNYFFKLSKYQDKLLKFYKENPDFVTPRERYNEVIAFVERGLEDFSISRETNTFGIKLPFDETQVTYVWFDALLFYYTSCRYSRGGDKNNSNFVDESDFFPPDLHVVGKDIIRFHAIYWPAMLMSLGFEIPKQILCGGHFTVDGHKISKSLGNVIEPIEYSKKYSKELLTLYILSAFPIGNDGDFDRKDAILTYNSKLANNFGNLLNRLVVLSGKLEGGKLENIVGVDLVSAQDLDIKNYDLKATLDNTFKFLDTLNKFTDENKPWNLIKEDEQKAREVLYVIAEGLRQVGLALYPFFPEKMTEMFEKLGLESYCEILEGGGLEELRDKKEVFNVKNDNKLLFERFELPEEKKSEDIRKDIKISINADLEKDGIKYAAAIFEISEITKKRTAKIKQYIKEVINNLDYSKIENSEFIKEAKKYYSKADLESDLHPAEVLAGFAKNSKNIPNINKIVDSYNIVTLEEILSVGVHDIEKIAGDVRFDYTIGDEHYIPLTKTEKLKINAGEYACLDEEKILCRMDIKQCDETKVSDTTKVMLIYVQGNKAVDQEYIDNGLKKVCDRIKEFAGGEYKTI